MNKSFIIFVIFWCFLHDLSANNTNFNQFTSINTNYLNKIVSAIYVIEGGNNTKYPYGIKSIKTNNPRKICENTVRNNYIRWQRAGSKGNYLDFLADRYCPPSADPIGNVNWKKNMKKILADYRGIQ